MIDPCAQETDAEAVELVAAHRHPPLGLEPRDKVNQAATRAVARLDDTAHYLRAVVWGDIEFPDPFGHDPEPEEDYIEQMDEKLGDFKTFLLDLNVRVESQESYACEDIKLEITKLDGSPLKKSNIEISKWHENLC